MKKRYKISKERILQISNDISEQMGNHSKAELTEVVKYFRDELDKQYMANVGLRDEMMMQLCKLLKDTRASFR